MTRVQTSVTVADRARWLAEISSALAEAENLIWQLAIAEARNVDVLDLSAKIETARAEARSMRISRADRSSIQADPKWNESLPWALQLERSA